MKADHLAIDVYLQAAYAMAMAFGAEEEMLMAVNRRALLCTTLLLSTTYQSPSVA